jgi:hypothetical protein
MQPKKKQNVQITVNTRVTRRNSTSIQLEKKRFSHQMVLRSDKSGIKEINISPEKKTGKLSQNSSLKSGQLKKVVAEKDTFQSPKTCSRLKRNRRDSPIIPAAPKNLKDELPVTPIDLIQEETLSYDYPCLKSKAELKERFKRQLEMEFSNLPNGHFKSEKELQDFLQNPTTAPDINEKFTEKMIRIKQERINHVVAQFEHQVWLSVKFLRCNKDCH